MKHGSLSARDVYKLRVALASSLPQKIAHPILIIMVGLPGSGKSYFASQLILQIPAVILESDYLRKTLVKRPIYSPKEHFRVFRAIHALTREFLEAKYSVILDATNLNEEYRQPLMKIAEETDAKSIIIYMETPREVAQNRLTKRIAERESYSDANWEVYQMLEGKYEPIKSSHLTVKSHMDISPVIDRIVSEVNRLK